MRNLSTRLRKSENPLVKENLHGLFCLTLVILLSLTLINSSFSRNDSSVRASTPKEEVNPNDYEDLVLATIEEAIIMANSQLTLMQYGNIRTIDQFDDGFFYQLILDYEFGNIVYWNFGDSYAEVSINAYSCEIISYFSFEWISGSLTQGQAETIAIQIAGQFSQFPETYEGPDMDLEGIYSYDDYNYTTDSFSHIEQNLWVLHYDRIKDNIVTEDYIEIWLKLNGDLCFYSKNWNMELNSFPIEYIITQTQAENIAITHAGSGSILESCIKKIVRPNSYWDEEGFIFGTSPTCAWGVEIIDSEDHFRIYQIDAMNGDIIGGDSNSDYNSQS